MEIIEAIVNFVALCVEALGAVVAIYGGITLMEGQSQQTAIKKLEGLQYVVGGVGIFLIGMKIVPMILNIFN